MKKWLPFLFPFLFLSVGLVPAADPPAIPKSSDKAEEAPRPKAKDTAAPKSPAEATPSLKAPETVEVEPGDLFTVKATTTARWVGFYAMDEGIKQFHLEDLFEGAKAKVGTYVATVPKDAPPGKVYRLFIYAGNSTVAAEPVITRIVVKGVPPPPPNPPPGPPNPPNPPTPPAPVGTVSYFVVVEDSSAPGVWRGDIMGSPKVESFYKALRGPGRTGAIHRLIDVHLPPEAQDPVAKAYIAKAAGKPLPYIWLLDSTGAVLKADKVPTESDDKFIAFFDLHANQPRSLGLIPAKKKLKWAEFGVSVNTPLIPRAQWKPVNLTTYCGPVHDQDGRGQCVASMGCSMVEACRNQAGLPYVYLSAGDLYSNINGGRDNGAVLEDAMAWLSTNGVTTVEKVPYVWNGRRYSTPEIVADRKNYMTVEVFLCPTFESAASAVQQGFHLGEALTWYNSYMRPGSDGWLPRPGGGIAGGHALHGCGLVQKNGTWGILTKNSWNVSFGGSADGTVPAGYCVIPESNFDDIPSNGFFAVRAVVQTPTSFPVKTKLNVFQPDFALAF